MSTDNADSQSVPLTIRNKEQKLLFYSFTQHQSLKPTIIMKQRSKHCAVKTILIGLFIQLITTPVSFGQNKAEQIDKLMNLYSEYGQFNGSILVTDAGKVIYKKGFGMANMEWNIPNQPDTKHRLGSVTKQFTSIS